MLNPLCLNYMRCAKCKHFTPEYAEAIAVYGEGFGLCNARKLEESIPSTAGFIALTVHENFGCIHFTPKGKK